MTVLPISFASPITARYGIFTPTESISADILVVGGGGGGARTGGGGGAGGFQTFTSQAVNCW